MRLGIKHFVILVAAAACGFGIAHWLDEGDNQLDWSLVHRTGNTAYQGSRFVMRSGSNLMLDLSDAKKHRSCIITFDVDFSNINDFALIAGGIDGNVVLVDADIGLGFILEKERGLLEIGFENERAYVQLDTGVIRKIPYESSKLRSLTIEARTSEFSIGGLSAIARHWEGYNPIQTKVLIDLDFKTARSNPNHMALIILISILAAFAYCLVEKNLIYMYAKPHPRTLQWSQALAFILLGTGLTLAAIVKVFESTQEMFLLGFAYHRLRFAICRTGLCVSSKSSPLTTALFVLSTTCASFCVAMAFRQIGVTQQAVIAVGFCTALLLIVLAVIYSLFSTRHFKAGLANMGWASLPMALVLIIPQFLPFAFLALGWPAFAGRKSMRYAGPIMLLSALMVLPATELTIRANVQEHLQRPANLSPEFEGHDLLFYAPRNFFQYEQDYLIRGNYMVEALNLRGGVAHFKKPKDVFRILVLGGSNAWGDGIADPKDTFSGRLEAILIKEHAPQKFQVLNGGVRGYNSFQIMIFFTQYAYKFSPDLVILYMNRNDVVNLWGIVPLREILEKKDRELNVSAFRRILRQFSIYNLLTRRMARAKDEFKVITNIEKATLVDANPPADVKRNMQDIIEKAKQIGAKSVVVSEFWGSIWHEKAVDGRFYTIRSATQELVSELGVPYFDAYSYFRNNYELWDVAFRHDPVHMTPYAHDRLAENLHEFIVENSLIPVHKGE